MALSKHWDNEIINDFNSTRNTSSIFNDDCMCMFSKLFDGKVNRDVAIFAKQNGCKEGPLYNNRLYILMYNQGKADSNVRAQYEANRRYILDCIK